MTRKSGPGGSNSDPDSGSQGERPGPTAFGRYQVVRHLASGGMGAVYLARDGVLQRDVAVKILHPIRGKLGKEFGARFLNEARCVASLKHPNIVPIFDLGLEGDSPYLVMEVVEGPSLGEVIANGPITLREARIIGIQIANALAEAHKAGIVHRDVKPGNILRSGPDSWKLVDFGVAHVPDSSLTGIGDFLGTPSYAASESLEGNGFSAASDVYGLAATLYHALVGQPPFGLGNAVKIALRASSEEAPSLASLNSQLPDDFVQIIDRCLAKASSSRPSAADLAEQLASARAESHDELVHSSTAVAPSPRGSRTWFALVGLVLVVIGGMAFVLSGDDAGRPDVATNETTPAASATPPKATQAKAAQAKAAQAKAKTSEAPALAERPVEKAREPVKTPGTDRPSDVGMPEPYLEGLDEIEKLTKRGADKQATRALDVLRKKHPDSAYLPYLQGSIYMERSYWQDGFASYRSAISKDSRYREHPEIVADAIRSLYSRSKPWMAVRFIEDSLGAAARPALEKAAGSTSNADVKRRIASLLKKLPAAE